MRYTRYCEEDRVRDTVEALMLLGAYDISTKMEPDLQLSDSWGGFLPDSPVWFVSAELPDEAGPVDRSFTAAVRHQHR